MIPDERRDEPVEQGDATTGEGGGSRRGRVRPAKGLYRQTWELELLISGAVVLALFQLPAVLDGFWTRAESTLPASPRVAVFFGYYYFKLILYCLMGTFLVHLVVRAWWVALLGLHSAYPYGVNWHDVRHGPNVEAVFRKKLPSLRALIPRVDGLASVIFSIGFSIVGLFLFSVLCVAILGAVAWVTGRLTDPAYAPWAFWVGLGLFVLVTTVPALLDRAFGRRFPDDGRWARTMRRLVHVAWGLGLRSCYEPAMSIVSSHSRRKMTVLLPFALAALVALFLVKDVLVPMGRLQLLSGPYFPDAADEASVLPWFYEDREVHAQRRSRLPSLPTDVIDADTPIVRLFVPYVPSRDDELLAAACPEVEPLRVASPHLLHTWTPPADGEPSHVVRECFGRLWRVSLDGEPVEEAPVFTYREPGPQPGLGIYLRVDALEPGRHLVRVERWQGPEDQLGRDEPQWAVFNLPFWR